MLLAGLCTTTAIVPASGQACCGPPTLALAGTERGVDPTALLTATLSYSIVRFAHTVNGTALVPDPLGRRALSHLWRIEAELVVASRWSLLLSVPIAWKERQLQSDTLQQLYRGSGVGDAVALVKYALYPASPEAPWYSALGLGLKAPTGSSDLEEDGVRLPRDLQPGTGTWEALGWGFVARTLADGLIGTSLSLLARTALTADEFGYRTGAELQALLTAAWLDCPLPQAFPSVAVRVRTTAPDRLAGQRLPATGGLWIDALPSITAHVSPFALRLQGMLPLMRRTNGIQLVPSWGATAELSWILTR